MNYIEWEGLVPTMTSAGLHRLIRAAQEDAEAHPALTRVRALHSGAEGVDGPWCPSCATDWPCPTWQVMADPTEVDVCNYPGCKDPGMTGHVVSDCYFDTDLDDPTPWPMLRGSSTTGKIHIHAVWWRRMSHPDRPPFHE